MWYALNMTTSRQTQSTIFATYNWWDKTNLLHQLTFDRCNYIEQCVESVFGRDALRQQEVLEIGCGGGLICEELARRGAVSFGIDPSQEALQVARQHTQQNNLGQSTFFEHGYAEALPYTYGSFSVIVCLDVLEHVRDLTITVREMARVLAPGGVLIFDTINRTFIARLALIWIGERFFKRYGLVPGLHNYQDFIKPRELQTLLLENELRLGEIIGFMPQLRKGRLSMGPGLFKGVSYMGYAMKVR